MTTPERWLDAEGVPVVAASAYDELRQSATRAYVELRREHGAMAHALAEAENFLTPEEMTRLRFTYMTAILAERGQW